MTIHIDQEICEQLMRRYQIETHEEAVNFALYAAVYMPPISKQTKPSPERNPNYSLKSARDHNKAFIDHLKRIPDVGHDDVFVRRQ